MNRNSPDLYAKEIQGVTAAQSQLKIKFTMHEEYTSIVKLSLSKKATIQINTWTRMCFQTSPQNNQFLQSPYFPLHFEEVLKYTKIHSTCAGKLPSLRKLTKTKQINLYISRSRIYKDSKTRLARVLMLEVSSLSTLLHCWTEKMSEGALQDPTLLKWTTCLLE